jgi:hypothetical protein
LKQSDAVLWARQCQQQSPIYGDDDRNVPFQQTTDLVEKLRAQDVAFEGLIIPDEIHDLLRWSDWIRATAPPNSSTANWSPRRPAISPNVVSG